MKLEMWVATLSWCFGVPFHSVILIFGFKFADSTFCLMADSRSCLAASAHKERAGESFALKSSFRLLPHLNLESSTFKQQWPLLAEGMLNTFQSHFTLYTLSPLNLKVPFNYPTYLKWKTQPLWSVSLCLYCQLLSDWMDGTMDGLLLWSPMLSPPQRAKPRSCNFFFLQEL